ncbi:MAG: permease [Balneolaceae bacterium]|nr:MAG: permease [Balneolaceae bacterium]
MFEWTQLFADWLIYGLIGIEEGTRLGNALNFFVYDVIKIMILLFLISMLMGVVNAWFPVERVRDFISSRKLYGMQYLLAAIFGAVTPFCSCSSVPLFIGFVKGGIPLGVTFAFLITSPLVNEVAIAVFLGVFGLKLTIIYATTGILLGTLGGYVLEKLKLDHLLTDWVQSLQRNSSATSDFEPGEQSLWQRMPEISREAVSILKAVGLYVLIGIGIGAGIHGYVPEGFFEPYIGPENMLAVPMAVILAVPLYANAAGIVPVIQVFVAKGIPIGTAIAFMMATIGLSIPEAALLKKVMSMKLILIFFGVVSVFIIISGLFFNLVL